MARRLAAGERIVLATHNKGKVREVAALVAPFGIEVVSAGELGLPEPAETETTFLGNARVKAVAAATLLRERDLVISRLRRTGGHIVDAPVGSVGPRLLNAYLDLKRRDLL